MQTISNFFSKHFYSILIATVVVYIFSGFAYCKLISADASNYLNIAENIVTHKGFVVSYNSALVFNTLYYPIWPYYQFLYPLFCSLFINHGGIVQIVKINVLLFAMNAAIIFSIVQNLIPTRLSVLFVFALIFSINCYLPAIYPWTEHLHFFCFILSFIVFLRYYQHPWPLFWIGLFNGVLMLLRESHIFNVLGYLLFILIGTYPIRKKFSLMLAFLSGFVLLYGAFQWWCWNSYHDFYPQDAKGSMLFLMSNYSKGIVYDVHKVGVQLDLGPFLTLEHLSNVGRHILSFIHQMPLFVVPSLFYFLLPQKKKCAGGLMALCFCQSIVAIVGFSSAYYMLDSLEARRYVMIPYILMSIVGWYCLIKGLSILESKPKKIILLCLLVILVFPAVKKVINKKNDLLKYPRWEAVAYEKDLFESFKWIDKNLPKEVLIASNERQECFFLHRPFVVTPEMGSFNCENFSRYNKIYAPDYYLLTPSISNECFEPLRHAKLFSNQNFRILRIEKVLNPKDQLI